MPAEALIDVVRISPAVLRPTHLERALGKREHTFRSLRLRRIYVLLYHTYQKQVFFFCSSSPATWSSRVVLSSPCSAASAEIWASTNPILASPSISVLKCSRLKQGFRRDGHPRFKSYFHDKRMVGAPPTSRLD